MRIRRLAVVILLLSVCAILTPHSPAAEEEARDEVVREVVRMLDAGVSEDVILRWLERDDRHPGELGSDDIIALTRAAASPQLMDRLMTEQPPAAPAPAALPLESDSGEVDIPVEFSIRYRPFRDSEADEDEQWHLFVYLDGRPLAWSEGRNWLSKSKKTVDVTPLVTPERHVVRLVQERHRRAGKQGWRHEARVCPDAIEFEATTPGRRVEIQVTEPTGLSLRGKSTLIWSMWDEGVPQDEGIPLSGPPDDWPPLCEEIETAYEEGEKIPKRVQKQLDRCVRWDSLWPGLTGIPGRDEVRALLERVDFRPVATSN
jgi:hypothetical protein